MQQLSVRWPDLAGSVQRFMHPVDQSSTHAHVRETEPRDALLHAGARSAYGRELTDMAITLLGNRRLLPGARGSHSRVPGIALPGILAEANVFGKATNVARHNAEQNQTLAPWASWTR